MLARLVEGHGPASMWVSGLPLSGCCCTVKTATFAYALGSAFYHRGIVVPYACHFAASNEPPWLQEVLSGV